MLVLYEDEIKYLKSRLAEQQAEIERLTAAVQRQEK